jgi:hypothetical protein
MDMILYVVLPVAALAAVGFFLAKRGSSATTRVPEKPEGYFSQTVSETYAQDTSSGPSVTFFLIKGAGVAQGVYFTLPESGGSIGSDNSKVTYALKENGVAAKHLVVSREHGKFVAKSASPELSFGLDGKTVTEAVLETGTVVKLGDAELRIKLG